MKHRGINDGKVLYRLEHFKDFQKTLVTINGGVIVATVAYTSSLQNDLTHIALGLWGIGALALTLLCQILLSFLAFIMLGFIYDGDDELAKRVGKVTAVPLTLFSLALTPFGFVMLFLFLAKTLA